MFIDSGLIDEQVKEKYPKGVDKVLELVGTTILKDSLRCASNGNWCKACLGAGDQCRPPFWLKLDILARQKKN